MGKGRDMSVGEFCGDMADSARNPAGRMFWCFWLVAGAIFTIVTLSMTIEAIDSMLAPPPESRPTAEQMLRSAFCEQRALTAEQTDQVLRRGAFQLQPKAAAAAAPLEGPIPGASPVVSFGAQESMAMSFDFGACGGDGPVYRACGAGGGAPAAPTLGS